MSIAYITSLSSASTFVATVDMNRSSTVLQIFGVEGTTCTFAFVEGDEPGHEIPSHIPAENCF